MAPVLFFMVTFTLPAFRQSGDFTQRRLYAIGIERAYCFYSTHQSREDQFMEWTFTSDQVAQGETDYSLEEFIDDFYEEVKDNFPEYGTEELKTISRIAYDVCYCTATRRNLDALLEHCKEKGLKVDMKYLELIRDSNLTNIAMLKALFARKVSEFVDEGLGSEDALKKLDEYHTATLAKRST